MTMPQATQTTSRNSPLRFRSRSEASTSVPTRAPTPTTIISMPIPSDWTSRASLAQAGSSAWYDIPNMTGMNAMTMSAKSTGLPAA